MSRAKWREHQRRPLRFARLVLEEYEDVFEIFPDASDALVARMLRISTTELHDCLRRARAARERPAYVRPEVSDEEREERYWRKRQAQNEARRRRRAAARENREQVAA